MSNPWLHHYAAPQWCHLSLSRSLSPHGSSPKNQIACNSKLVTAQCSWSRYWWWRRWSPETKICALACAVWNVDFPGIWNQNFRRNRVLLQCMLAGPLTTFAATWLISPGVLFHVDVQSSENSRLMLLPTPYFCLDLRNMMMFQFQLWQWQWFRDVRLFGTKLGIRLWGVTVAMSFASAPWPHIVEMLKLELFASAQCGLRWTILDHWWDFRIPLFLHWCFRNTHRG